MLKNSFFSNEQFYHSLDVVAIENALVDLLIKGTDSDLRRFEMTKGAMQLTDDESQKTILSKLSDSKVETELGGSVANVLRGMAVLGADTSYSSAVGNDYYGQTFAKRMSELNIQNRLAVIEGAQTGTCLIIVTPDGERTLNTHLGACRSYQIKHVPYDDIVKSKIFFSSGYMLDTQAQIDALHAAIDHALNNNVKVAFDMGDSFVITRHGKRTLSSLLEKVHLVFLNEREARMLTDKSPKAAALELAQSIQIAVVKDGENGAYIAHEENVIFAPARKVKVVDTTGAGDMFAGGFMFGLCRGLPFEKCAQIATHMASDTVTHMGVRLSPEIPEQVKTLL